MRRFFGFDCHMDDKHAMLGAPFACHRFAQRIASEPDKQSGGSKVKCTGYSEVALPNSTVFLKFRQSLVESCRVGSQDVGPGLCDQAAR